MFVRRLYRPERSRWCRTRCVRVSLVRPAVRLGYNFHGAGLAVRTQVGKSEPLELSSLNLNSYGVPPVWNEPGTPETQIQPNTVQDVPQVPPRFHLTGTLHSIQNARLQFPGSRSHAITDHFLVPSWRLLQVPFSQRTAPTLLALSRIRDSVTRGTISSATSSK